MVIVITGPGKGKTTSAVGQTLRALGAGLDVAFCQFLKAPEYQGRPAGEQLMLAKLLGENFHAGGLGFYFGSRQDGEEYERHRRAALDCQAWARGRLQSGAQMLVLDEALYALGSGLLTREELESLLDGRGDAHVVLTGRGLPDWLLERADLVSSVEEVKHPFAEGEQGCRGVEF